MHTSPTSAEAYRMMGALTLRLMKQQKREEQARRTLQPLYEWFTEGFETKDLREAKALLDELAGAS